NVVYDAHNEVACLILESMTPELHRQFETYSPYDILQELKSMFEKQAGVERFDLIQIFHASKREEGKPVGIDFAGFIKNYNKHNMGKTIGELHALLIEYEKGLSKKAATPHVKAIQGGRIQKANKKSLNAKGKGKGKGKGKDKSYISKPKNPKHSVKEHPTQDDTCHHCKEVGHCKRNCPAYLAELIKKKKQVGTSSSLDIFTPHCVVVDMEESVRTHRAPERLCINIELEEHSFGDLNEPTKFKAELLDLESDEWLDAMNARMQSMKDNQVWRLVDLPPNSKGFTQTYEVDYEETFSSVADIRAIRILIAIAAFYDYEIWQMDVKTAFLNGYLDEDIYMV
nr:hypothetical protein [Tanacetum cinerariifolium]